MHEVVLVSDYDLKKNKLKTSVKLPIQFIFVNWKVEHILDRFDYAFCQISFDGREIQTTQAYLNDKDNKVMSLVRCKGQLALQASVERYRRWASKYPDFSWQLACHLDMGPKVIIDIGFP